MGEISQNEAHLYNHWTILLTLLEKGIPWDYIQQMLPNEVSLVLALMAAKAERENELQAKG